VPAGRCGPPRTTPLEAFRSIKQQDRRLIDAVRLQRDPAAHEADRGPLQLAQRHRLSRLQKPQRRSRSTGELFCLRGGERASGELFRIDRELGRAFEKGRGGSQSAARLRAPGRMVELSGHLFVGSRRGLCSMPCSPVGIEPRIGDLGERSMRVVSFPR
jgi:hypothetical protein